MLDNLRVIEFIEDSLSKKGERCKTALRQCYLYDKDFDLVDLKNSAFQRFFVQGEYRNPFSTKEAFRASVYPKNPIPEELQRYFELALS